MDFTDDKPMACFFTRISASNNLSPRQARQLSFIAEYIDGIHNISGSENIVDTGYCPLVLQLILMNSLKMYPSPISTFLIYQN